LLTKLSDYVFQFVADQGVKHVFMVPGGGAMHLVDSLGRNPNIEYVCNLHEQASAIAAEAYARVTNNLGVALVTTGPGGTNTVTGVAGAWLDSTPCLFISGQVKRADLVGDRGLRQLGVQEIDIVSIIKSITKYAITILEPDEVRYHLEKATYLAKNGRPGPVWIDIPLDVQAAMIDPETLTRFTPDDVSDYIIDGQLDSQIHHAIDLFNLSERPIILVGNGTRISGAADDFLKLVDLLGVPVLTTRLGVDLISGDHPLSMGMPGAFAPRGANFALQNSDFLLILGARLDMALIAYDPVNLARGAKKVMVNIDANEMKKLDGTLDTSLAIDARIFITKMLENSAAIKHHDRSVWLARCQGWKKNYPIVQAKHRQQLGKVSVYHFAEVVSSEVGDDWLILPGNAGNASEIFLTAFKAKNGQRIFHNKGTGAMGFCQPAAIGACLASGGKPTICVDGDGGFQLNIQELETVHRLNLPVKFFVMNNGGYASIRASQRSYYGRLTGADATSGMTLPDIKKVADAYGLGSLRIEDNQKLYEQVRQVLNLPGPIVCDVVVIPDEPREPRISSKHNEDGSIISTPLEDMAPFLSREELLSNFIDLQMKENYDVKSRK
jgi:acetolactate synthase-1/2/3 large subunit